MRLLDTILDLAALLMLFAALATVAYTLGACALEGYVIKIATNTKGEALAEMIAVGLFIPFASWRAVRWCKKRVKDLGLK